MSDQPELSWEQLERLGAEISHEDGMWSEGWNAETSHTRSFNEAFIEAFRSNSGVIPGELAETHPLLLTVVGAKTGITRVVPLFYFIVEGATYVIASGGAARKPPPWYYNVKATPEVTVEIGSEAYPARARVLDDDEHGQIWTEIVRQFPMLADHESHAQRAIPIIELVRRSAPSE